MKLADILKEDRETIDTQKVVFQIWENRNNLAVVNELADRLRCTRLKEDIERAVVYGTVTSKSMKDGVADTLSEVKSERFDGRMNGSLLFKRNNKKGVLHTKGWKQRHFVIDRRVLTCFRDPYSVQPLRSVSLQNCVVEMKDSVKYGKTCFDVINEANGIHFQLRAADEAERQKWVNVICSEISGIPHDMADSAKSAPDTDIDTTNDTDPAPSAEAQIESSGPQSRRLHHFRQQLVFATNLTNICERLRFVDPSDRQRPLQHDMKNLTIPPLVSMPLASSLDTFSYILRALPSEGHAFSTKARVPALMIFEMQNHPRGTDMATFLGLEIEKYPQSDIVVPGAEIVSIVPHSPETAHGGKSGSNWESVTVVQCKTDTTSTEIKQLPSKFRDNINLCECESVWKAQGTGMKRLMQFDGNNDSEYYSAKDYSDTVLSTNSNASDINIRRDSNCSNTISTPNAESEVVTLLGETFLQKAERIRRSSPYGHLPGWRLDGLIAKSNDDVRQEVFVMQMISYYQIAFKAAKLDAWLYTYRILSTSKSTGLIQLIPNAISLDGLKKKEGFHGSLAQYFKATYGYSEGGPNSTYRTAIDAYIRSMAGYSIVSYLLGIKDRHNGNVMLDNQGHIIHIDFGFVFGLAPGKQFSMEKAPWKLTKEMTEVMGGRHSGDFVEYTRQCVQALLVARKHAKQVAALMEIMMFRSNYPAFLYNPRAIDDFKSRLFLDLPDKDIPAQVVSLINRSYNSLGTRLYDDFQLTTNGIAP